MRIKTDINKLGQIYIPKKIQEIIGIEGTKEVDYIADARAILIIPSDFSNEEALKSIDTIRAHLKHEVNLEKKVKEVVA